MNLENFFFGIILINISLFSGLFAILLALVAVVGYFTGMKNISNLYYEGWIKKKKVLPFYYLIVSSILIILGVLVILYELDIKTPFSY
jgi:uncharacterized membrane protein